MREARGPEWTDWLREHGVVALTGIDTRSLVLQLREHGAMRAVAVAGDDSAEDAVAAARAQTPMAGRALARGGVDAGAAVRRRGGPRADRGRRLRRKDSVLRRLAAAGAAVTVFPHDVDADTLAGFDGVLLSPGPGDPEPLADEAETSASCSAGRTCSGSASATSSSASPPDTRRSSSRSATAARTIRCSSARSGRVLVTSQNHGFAVRAKDEAARRTSRSTTTRSRDSRSRSCGRARCSSIPEAGPGPHDAWPLLQRWVDEVAAYAEAHRHPRRSASSAPARS